jgi:excisionase family DNA binding protein
MDRLLRVDEVCARLALGRTRVYELIQAGELPSVQIGAARRIPESVLEQFVAQRLTGTGALDPTQADAEAAPPSGVASVA